VDLYPSVSNSTSERDTRKISVKIAVNGIPARFKVLDDGIRANVSSSFGLAGEDAFFTKREGQYLYAGVADGVYDWKLKGIYPGLWSQTLILNIKNLCSRGWREPQELLTTAYKKNLLDGHKGSSTACLLRIDLETGQLVSTNVGDSGYVVVSTSTINGIVNARLKYHSVEREHHLGSPLQLGSHNVHQSPVDEAESNTVQLQQGDFVVLGSDGLFDNLLGEDLIAIIADDKQSLLQKCCSILNKCYNNVSDPKCETPYSRASSEEMNMIFYGGKDDDISCCVIEVLQHS